MEANETVANMIDLKGQWRQLKKRIAYIESLDETIHPSKEEDLGYWLNVRKELLEVGKILNITLD